MGRQRAAKGRGAPTRCGLSPLLPFPPDSYGLRTATQMAYSNRPGSEFRARGPGSRLVLSLGTLG